MKYAAFFIVMLALAIQRLTVVDGPRYIVWTSVLLCAGAMCVAYALNRPGYVLSKAVTGDIHPLVLIVNLPWVGFTWAVFLISSAWSRENRMDDIPDTRWTIGRYPGTDYPPGYDVYIDLTAEFPRPTAPEGVRYYCLPYLDAMPLAPLPSADEIAAMIPPDARVFVHCAQGHGRSATWSSIALASLFPAQFPTPTDALAAIQSARPDAKPNAAQRRQIDAVARPADA